MLVSIGRSLVNYKYFKLTSINMDEGAISIHVENFKGLKDFTLECRKFNVLIGVNGSGKTSVLELFKFANLCIDPVRTPPYPFGPWSGYKNIVWSTDTTLPISLDVKYRVGQHDVDYKMVIDGSSGKLEFVSEELTISHYIHIQRSFQDAVYKLDPKLLKQLKLTFDLGPHAITSRFLRNIPKKQWTERINSSASVIKQIRGLVIRRSLPSFARRELSKKTTRSGSDPVLQQRFEAVFGFSYSESGTTRVIPSIMVGDGINKNPIHQSATSLFSGDLPMILLQPAEL